MTTKILFVCLGNICRSPLAEGVCSHLLETRGLESKYEVDSAGTSGWHQGCSPDERSVAIAAKHGIDIKAQRARQVVLADRDEFDLIVAMDRSNLEELRGLGISNARLLSSFEPNLEHQDVPDPYYGGPDGFQTVYDMVLEGCEGVIRELETSLS